MVHNFNQESCTLKCPHLPTYPHPLYPNWNPYMPTPAAYMVRYPGVHHDRLNAPAFQQFFKFITPNQNSQIHRITNLKNIFKILMRMKVP